MFKPVFLLPWQEEKTPLHVAAEKGNTTVVEKLLDYKSEVNKKDKVRVTVIWLSCLVVLSPKGPTKFTCINGKC